MKGTSSAQMLRHPPSHSGERLNIQSESAGAVKERHYSSHSQVFFFGQVESASRRSDYAVR